MTKNEIKKTGATFTPYALAKFIAGKILSSVESTNDPLVILDPACGDGALLAAIQEISNRNIESLIGYDTNDKYLAQAVQNISKTNYTSEIKLICSDFLEICPSNIDLFSQSTQREFADIVIANPPYVRTQTLGADKAQKLSRDFNLTGRIDLYYPFLIAMTNALKKGGILGVITSNRYLSTKSGGDIRRFLIENYDIIEIIDLGDTKLFDAAVLPAIFIGRKKDSQKALSKKCAKYISIYETDKEIADNNLSTYSTIYDVLGSNLSGFYQVNKTNYELKIGLLKHPADKTGIWQMSTESENAWIDTINKNTSFKIKEKFKVRVGIKSCADNIFISRLWEVEGVDIEEKLLRPMISQENIETWAINEQTMLNVLYPHYSEQGKRKVYNIDNFPSALRYLKKHREQLEGRNYLIKAGRKWYEYWVPQNPDLWKLPKVVFPDISVRPRFCFDESGALVNGNCYWMCAQNEDERNLLLLIEGVCNSDVMVKYHDLCFNNKLYSGRRRYLAQYIEEYPIPSPELDSSKRIISIVKQINITSDETQKSILSSEVNELVKISFGLRG